MRVRRLGGELPQAACADRLDLIDAAANHPGGPEASELKRKVCPHCPIAHDCLTAAMTSRRHEWGVWGATGANERTKHGAISEKADRAVPR